MREKALEFYRQGYNCSQCILKAAGSFYSLPVNSDMENLLSGINLGFGIGAVCSVLVGAVMAFGLIFDAETLKRVRIELFDRFAMVHYGCICCPMLKSENKEDSCEGIIMEIAELTERIIDEHLDFKEA